MSWQELKKIVETNDLDRLVDWVETNKELIDQQVLGERVQKLFGTKTVKFEEDDLSPFYDDYLGMSRVGLNWKCSEELWAFLLSRPWTRDVSINEDSAVEKLRMEGARRYRDDKWEQDESYTLYRQIRYNLQDPAYGVRVTVEVSLNKGFDWLGEVSLPEIPFTPEMTQEEVQAKARELFLVHREELYQLAKYRHEQGYDPDLEGT